jgi:hypothetical protein
VGTVGLVHIWHTWKELWPYGLSWPSLANCSNCNEDISVFHAVISRRLIERQILLVGVVCAISDVMEVGVNSSAGYTVTVIGGDGSWEHRRYPAC